MTPEKELTMSPQLHECINDEEIKEIASETHKYGAWFKVFGSGLGIGFALLMWFGSGINAKLDAIQASLNRADVSLMEHSQRIKVLEEDIREIKERHRTLDIKPR